MTCLSVVLFVLVGFVAICTKLGLRSKIGFSRSSFVSPARIKWRPFPYLMFTILNASEMWSRKSDLCL